ncbi:hypothetical protein, partial [Pyramidobacter piscolens]|uniref:hypothetical protein n=1 Tax=Pyramidobacter piscolens TaxID=638849 RepID=UPI003AF589D5
SIKNKILNHSLKLPEPPAQPGVFFEQKIPGGFCRRDEDDFSPPERRRKRFTFRAAPSRKNAPSDF